MIEAYLRANNMFVDYNEVNVLIILFFEIFVGWNDLQPKFSFLFAFVFTCLFYWWSFFFHVVILSCHY